MRLYQYPGSPHCLKVRAVAYELGLELEPVEVDVLRGGSRTPSFVEHVNPNGLVPVLVDGDFVLWESNAILTYLAAHRPEAGLVPTAPRARAEVDRWLHWQSAHLGPAAARLAFASVFAPLVTGRPVDPAAVHSAAVEVLTCCRVLEASLAGEEHVAGALSVADFALGCILFSAGSAGLGLERFPRTDGWLRRVLSRDATRRALAEAQHALVDRVSSGHGDGGR